MEKWLDSDKTLILDEALRDYGLAWHEVITHAFLTVPDQPCKSAKVEGRPWRYSKYRIMLFLVTGEGVYEVSTDLDFQNAERWLRQRHDYRFDAFSSVRVERLSRYRYTLHITLTNGSPKSVTVSGEPVGQEAEGEGADETAEIDLEASGFRRTLRILEGIAAEGRAWFDRDRGATLPTGPGPGPQEDPQAGTSEEPPEPPAPTSPTGPGPQTSPPGAPPPRGRTRPGTAEAASPESPDPVSTY